MCFWKDDLAVDRLTVVLNVRFIGRINNN